MKILSPAKINLFLQITGKRQNGYHDLFTLMCCISLYDTVSLSFGTKRTTVSCNNPEVPEDESNLAVRAANLFFETLHKNEGVKIGLEKKIPVAAGLGGGSSNAASVLLGLNRYYGRPLTQDKLMSMGLSIGTDIPFFIFRKPAIVSGIGEKLEAYEGLKPFQILLVCPKFAVSTKEIYKNLNLELTKYNKKLRNIVFKKKVFDIKKHLCNDLKNVTASICPDVNKAKETLLSCGAIGALMSGSGPAVFGIFPDFNKALIAYNAILNKHSWSVFQAEILI
ncbi:MAG: 4-(cytidine 5'-diphospho)-2-C-methyl-D-erythritol kinase [Desulfobacterales bacterium]|nr:4-(cytidine 5'-diphospho)-2-C-methyl-D-erythritol kinase [Desulfobacterales bacterium]